MVFGGPRDQIRIMPDYPLRHFLPDFGPRPSSWGLFLALTDFQVLCSPVPNPQPDADQTGPPDECRSCQQPLPDGSLRIVPRCVKEDASEPAT
jgi:hypothetical protein